MTIPARSLAGASQITTLATGATAGDTSLSLSSTAGWTELGSTAPLGTSGEFMIALDFGANNEELVLCPQGSLSGTTISGALLRGAALSGSTSHSSGANVAVVLSPYQLKEAYSAAVSTSNLHGNTGTTTAPSPLTGGTASPGSSKFAAAADHTHDVSAVTGIVDTGYNALNTAASSGLSNYTKVLSTSSATGYTSYLCVYTVYTQDVSASSAHQFNLQPGHTINGSDFPVGSSHSRIIIQPNDSGTNSITLFHSVSATSTDNVSCFLEVSRSVTGSTTSCALAGQFVMFALA
jgi:hypothetical protein